MHMGGGLSANCGASETAGVSPLVTSLLLHRVCMPQVYIIDLGHAFKDPTPKEYEEEEHELARVFQELAKDVPV